jgi:looped-hinge helix DNA binding domain, AbrB family
MSYMGKVIARITSKSQLVLPKEVRARLDVGPGDTLEFRIDGKGVHVEKAQTQDDPFATFDEWASKADDDAYRDL